jgi:hypothetical protein
MAADINRNPDGTYLSEDQILADLPNRVTDAETLALIKSNFTPSPEHRLEAIQAIHDQIAFSRWIRNSYGLWREDNPYTLTNPPANEEGIIYHPMHPDNLSGRIVDRFVISLQD